ncbi:MAG: hypothetical protein AB9917_20815 [Negativicutes bacterium]
MTGQNRRNTDGFAKQRDMQQNSIWRIFFDSRQNWERFAEKNRKRIRPVVFKVVTKFQHCSDPGYGFMLLVYEGRHDVKIVAYPMP